MARAEARADRDSYRLWEEPGPGAGTRWKSGKLYRQLGVREYWMFDETGRRLRDESKMHIGRAAGSYLRVFEFSAGKKRGLAPSSCLVSGREVDPGP